jgi:hypothetical protein
MEFNRDAFTRDMANLRSAPSAHHRAIGDNLGFEENVGSDRLADFENYAPNRPLRAALASYFNNTVQGQELDHIPSTFSAVNAAALISGMAEVQKIVRLERIDSTVEEQAFGRSKADTFSALEDALAARTVDQSLVSPFIRAFATYPGARPAFACFKAEVAGDLTSQDWIARLIARLGLGHHNIPAGQVGYFALMEYTVREVYAQALPVMDARFAVPTVLDGRESSYFFPAPRTTNEGFAVDLAPTEGRNAVREFLHVRITYKPEHMVRVGALHGPTANVDLMDARDRHLERIRARTNRFDYGELMQGAA